MNRALLETTRMLLAVGRAADLGEQGATIDDLAAEFGLQAEALRHFVRRLDRLDGERAAAGEMIDCEIDEADRLRVHYAPGLDADLPLSGDEAVALLAGLARLGLAEESVRRLEDSLLAQLSAADAERVMNLRRRLRVADAEPFRVNLSRAAAAGEPCDMLYHSGKERAWRTVWPAATVSRDGMAYLGAWCCLRQAERLFRLDRVLAIRPASAAERPASVPSSADVHARLDAMLAQAGARGVTLTARNTFGQRLLRDRFGAKAERADGSWRAKAFAGPHLADWVVGCAGAVGVLRPKAFAEQVRSRARARLEAYEGSPDESK
jgi:predicted DNA-binding transcriptional regulator YafY